MKKSKLSRAGKSSIGYLGGICMSIFLGACSSTNIIEPEEDFERFSRPRVFSIGYSPSLSFSKERPLVIPIEGLGLAGDREYEVSVDLDATYPITPDDYYYKPSIRNGDAEKSRLSSDKLGSTRLNLYIGKEYLQKVETGDQMVVTIYITPKPKLSEEQRNAEKAIRLIDYAASQSRVIEDELEEIEKYFGDLEKVDLIEYKGKLKLLRSKLISGEMYIQMHGKLFDGIDISDSSGYVFRIVDSALRYIAYSFSDSIEKLDRILEGLEKMGAENQRNLSELSSEIERTSEGLKELESEYNKAVGEIKKIRNELENSQKNAVEDQSENSDFFSMEVKISEHRKTITDYYALLDELEGLKDEQRIARENQEEIFQNIKLSLSTISGLKPALSNIKSMSDDVSNSLVEDFYRNNDSDDGDRLESVSVHRDFTFHEVSEFRDNFIGTRILPDDISAFPLPADEVVDLFGHYIAYNYFVVRLSLRNTDQTDKLVNSGMIRVSGRAMVEVDLDGRDGDGKGDYKKSIRYTVPIEVTPHSKEQIYTVLDDTEIYSSRSFVFRWLEFGGALATGYTTAFINSETTAKGVGLFTGILTPELRKLWEDRYPDYKRNIVNYGMEDLTKVPANATTAHKFLFFPRSKIETVVLDPGAYGRKASTSDWPRAKRLKEDETRNSLFDPRTFFGALSGRSHSVGYKQPETYIVNLLFDNMDIPLEYVSHPTDVRLAETVVMLETAALSEIRFRTEMRDHWRAGETLPIDVLRGLTFTEWSSLESAIIQIQDTAKQTKLAGVLEDDASKLKNVIDAIQNLSSLLEEDGRWKNHLLMHEDTAIADLSFYEESLKVITRALARGEAPAQYDEKLARVKAFLDEAKKRRSFYVALGEFLGYLESSNGDYQFPGSSDRLAPLEVLTRLSEMADADITDEHRELGKSVMKSIRSKLTSLKGLSNQTLDDISFPDFAFDS